MDLERRRSPALPHCELRVAGKGKLTGYASVFNKRSMDLGGFFEVIKPGSFRESLRRGDPVKATIEHTGGLLTLATTRARTLALSEDSYGLKVGIDVPNTSAGRDVLELVGRGDLAQMSFAFRSSTVEATWEETHFGTLRTITKAELHDVTITGDPAYVDTTVSVRTVGLDARSRRIVQRLRIRKNSERLESEGLLGLGGRMWLMTERYEEMMRGR